MRVGPLTVISAPGTSFPFVRVWVGRWRVDHYQVGLLVFAHDLPDAIRDARRVWKRLRRD